MAELADICACSTPAYTHAIGQYPCPHGRGASEAADFALAAEERAAIMRLWVGIRARIVDTDELLAHVTGLASAYRAQGYVMGDLAHDGTLKAQAEAGEQ